MLPLPLAKKKLVFSGLVKKPVGRGPETVPAEGLCCPGPPKRRAIRVFLGAERHLTWTGCGQGTYLFGKPLGQRVTPCNDPESSRKEVAYKPVKGGIYSRRREGARCH